MDPATLSDDERQRAGTVRLPEDQETTIAALDSSERLRRILGAQAVDVLVAVRRYESQNYADLEPEQLAEKFRMAWST